jgi:cytoskeletal protein CcmA (bactofilin family)
MWKKDEKSDDENNFASSTPKPAPTTSAARPASNGSSTVGSNSFITGEIRGEEDLFILGKFDGTAYLENNVVTIGKTGTIKGTILAKVIMVEGSVEGDMKAREKIIIKETAKVKGNISTERLVMEDGCFFQGSVDMSEIKPKTASGVNKPATPPNKPKA